MNTMQEFRTTQNAPDLNLILTARSKSQQNQNTILS